MHNTPITQPSARVGVASSDEVTRYITGSAASPPRYAQVRGGYCRLLSDHPLGEMSLIFRHLILRVTKKSTIFAPNYQLYFSENGKRAQCFE